MPDEDEQGGSEYIYRLPVPIVDPSALLSSLAQKHVTASKMQACGANEREPTLVLSPCPSDQNRDVHGKETDTLEQPQKARSRPLKYPKNVSMHRKIRATHEASPGISEQSKTLQSSASARDTLGKEQQEHKQPLPQVWEPSENAFKHLACYGLPAKDSSAHETGQIDLSRVRNQILRAGFDCPDLCRRLGETAEDAVVRVLEQYRKLNIRESQTQTSSSASKPQGLRPTPQGWWDYKERLVAREQDVEELEAELTEQNRKHEQEVLRVTDTVKRLQQELMQKDSRIIEEAMKHKSKLASLKQEEQSAVSNLIQERDTLNAQITSLNLQNKKIESAHAERLRKENKQLMIGLREEMQREASKRVEEERNLHGKSVANLHESLDRLNKQLEAEHSEQEACKLELETAKALLKQQELHAKAQFDKQEAFYTDAIHKERAAQEKRLAAYQDQLYHQEEQLREARKTDEEKSTDERRRLDLELQKQKSSLAEQHEKDIYTLRAVIEDFKLAFTTREQSKGLTNTELVTRFSKLAQDVEDFARLEWDPAREEQWWTQQIMQLNPRNTRKLKQKLVQNSLWISLHEHVFRSPFRLFAAEQEWKEFDKHWIEIYAFATSASQWPAIHRETEKARYESAKQLRAAIYPSVKAGTADRLEQLKTTYEQAVASAVTNIAAKIEQVATLKEKDRIALHKIVRLSAELWLECCSQRCRILVALSSGIEDVLGVSQGNIRLVKVVLKPALRKFGNTHGDNLTVEEPIAGWRQEVEVYPPQRVVSV